MGIPTYFRYLFEQHGPEILSFSVKNVDHLYFDFNSIIYNVYYKKLEENQNQKKFLANIYMELKTICLTVNPKKTVYLFFDGPVPRAKMVQQRSRRYKSIQLEGLLQKKKSYFNPSNNICPGTIFMYEMTKYLKENFVHLRNELPHHPEILMSDSNSFGEGEHKMMPLIRNLDDENDSLCVMSPDNDLLSLLILTGHKNIYLLRVVDSMLKKIIRMVDESSLIFIDMDTIREKFKQEQKTKISSLVNIDEENLLLDYNFLLSMVGNDFVAVLPYMRIKSGGMNTLLSIYTNIINDRKKYLIDKQTLSIDQDFFQRLVSELSKMEFSQFRKLGSFIHLEQNKTVDDHQSDEKLEDKINHLYLCNPASPLYDTYKQDFDRMTFHGSIDEMKRKYYNHFEIIGTKKKNEMIQEYLKSLKFTLLYYNEKCPSTEWFYKYRCAPFFSDVLNFLNRENINELSFATTGKIFTPFQQLLFILPSVSKHILPPSFHGLFQKYKMNYPEHFKVDALQGLKYIYSEAILPEFKYVKSMENDIRMIEQNSLSDFEKERNKITL